MKKLNRGIMKSKKCYDREILEVLNKNDFNEFKKFVMKHRNLYSHIPTDMVLEISMYKVMCEHKNIRPEVKEYAEAWLLKKGFYPGIGTY